jgi:hypothetical protein
VTSDGDNDCVDDAWWLHRSWHGHEGWDCWLTWARDTAGRAVPVRFEISSPHLIEQFGEPIGAEAADNLRPLSREVIKTLPLWTFIAESRESALNALGPGHEDRESYEARPPNHFDDKLRRALVLYREETLAPGNRAPYQATAERLYAEGITSRGGEPPTARRVAKWVKTAIERGLDVNEAGEPPRERKGK